MKRVYADIIEKHLNSYSQMAFISGARQVGKTTIAKDCANHIHNTEYLNWDNVVHRQKILSLLEDTEKSFKLGKQLSSQSLIILDELHKFKNWKNYLKGFYDTYKEGYKIILTGSARLNVYRKGGDSLMGRYFNYTIHPFTVGEVARPKILQKHDIQLPTKCDTELYHNLFKFGGYPEPFLNQKEEFHRMWQNLRFQQLFREEIRDSEDIKAIGQLELLAHILQNQSGGLLNYSTLASKIQVTSHTIKKWIQLLETFYFCFRIKPWSNNLSRALIKEPKIYLCDWSVISDKGAKFENFIASHLIKSVDLWNETGVGAYELYYIRTKEKKEVDFLLTKDHKPWVLIEAKYSHNNSISENLIYFKEKVKVPHAFQVVFDLPYVEKDCFAHQDPIIVPAQTFLSQFA